MIALTALIQARLLPEIELDTVLNLPLVLLLPLSSGRRRATLVAGALIAGLLLDALLWRPLGQTALTLCVGVLVAAAARGGGDAGWARRSLAAIAGYCAAAATALLSSGLLGIGTTGFESAQLERHGVKVAGDAEELRPIVRAVLDEAKREMGITQAVELGVMIETPAAAVTADLIADRKSVV